MLCYVMLCYVIISLPIKINFVKCFVPNLLATRNNELFYGKYKSSYLTLS